MKYDGREIRRTRKGYGNRRSTARDTWRNPPKTVEKTLISCRFARTRDSHLYRQLSYEPDSGNRSNPYRGQFSFARYLCFEVGVAPAAPCDPRRKTKSTGISKHVEAVVSAVFTCFVHLKVHKARGA